jgi:hypothetical protein
MRDPLLDKKPQRPGVCARDTTQGKICDFYEARLMEELDTLTRRGSESIAAIHSAVEQGVN